MIIKAESNKHINLFRSKSVNQEVLIKFYHDLKISNLFEQLFYLNDQNGKWLAVSIHRHLYHLIKKYSQKFVMPKYQLRDYQEVFSLYPFVIREEEKNNTL